MRAICLRIALLLVTLSLGSHAAARNIALAGTFEEGRILAASLPLEGLQVQTLPDPQVGSEILQITQGGLGPTAASDTKVVPKEYVGDELVLPRAGEYFLRSKISYDKNYSNLNPGDADRPRSGINLAQVGEFPAFDDEGWLGFSLHLPENFQHENGVHDHRGSIMLLSVHATPDATFFQVTSYVPEGETVAHWFVMLQINPKMVLEGAGTVKSYIDLGPVTADLGRWTDFVVRFRSNPFSETTNPRAAGISGAMNATFEGNKGILQVWKAEGPEDTDGNRPMVLKVDKVNVPVGLVPSATEKLRLSFRIYKYGWKNNPTTVTKPVWVGFDEFRYGSAGRDGTRYPDVLPGSARPSDSPPMPPVLM
jgi:hypothetical protein